MTYTTRTTGDLIGVLTQYAHHHPEHSVMEWAYCVDTNSVCVNSPHLNPRRSYYGWSDLALHLTSEGFHAVAHKSAVYVAF